MIHLQDRVKRLEQELAQAVEGPDESLDPEVLMRGASLVQMKENAESRYLGPSSGIAMVRLVMELAKQNAKVTSIKDIVPEREAQEIKDRFAEEAEWPTSKVYPLISFVAAPDLPTRGLTERLVENFNNKGPFCLQCLLA